MVNVQAQSFPYAVQQAFIQACGKVFHYRNGLVELFVTAGVPVPAVERYVSQDLVKYQIARAVLADLGERGAGGRRVQWQLVDAILGLDGPADDAADPGEAKAALEKLRRVAGRTTAGAAAEEPPAINARRRKAELKRRVAERQATKTQELRERFAALAAITDKQERGYSFERFLRDLFQANEIEYRSPFRVGVEQIDGAFRHASRDFLVEARWRGGPPSASDLLTFAMKVQGKLEGTLGLVITMTPPRSEVVEHVATRTRSIIVMDGRDLALILEGQVTLAEALAFKQRRAAQEGVLFSSVDRAHAA